jgi:hypothetical protein
MRIGIGIAVVVAIGLIWSVAVMSQWVPVASLELRSAAVIQPYEAIGTEAFKSAAERR